MASSKGTLDSFIIRSKRPRSEIQLNQTVEASSAETVPNQNETSVNSSIQEDIPIISPMISSGHIISDPGVRPPMSSIGFNSAEREKIRRAYLNKGPCQPKLTRFPITFFSGKPRKFNPEWYKDFGAWLEYSERKDAVYCLCCYLFNIEYGDHKFNHDSFIREGFRNWKKKDRLRTHMGDQTSSHNKCLKACEDLLNQKQHVDIMIAGISTQAKLDYRIRLNATIECVRMLLMQALAFRGHDESEHSKNQGNLLVEVCEFCEKNEIDILNMDEAYVPRGRSQRKVHKVTNHHHFKTQLLVAVVDFQLKEMNERFDNVNMELLTCISCLDPRHSFLAFDKQKLIQLAKFYPFEFDGTHLLALEDQLENYIVDMRSNDNFQDLKGVGELAERMVQKQKDIGFPLVYMLVRLALTLPVATATVERGFSAMNLIKNVLRNTMGDTWLNDCLVTYVERDVFEKIENEAIMQRFQEIKNRRMLL